MLLAGRYTLLEQGGARRIPAGVRQAQCLGDPGRAVQLGHPDRRREARRDPRLCRRPAPLIDKAQKIEAVCRRHGVELGAAALQFPLFHPALCAVIPGALGVAEVKQNVARLSAKIPAELWSELKREKLLDANAPTPN